MIFAHSLSTSEILLKARGLVEQVCDPEIPVLTLKDLGVVRDVKMLESGQVEVVITPTYSGCPAMDVMAVDITLALEQGGFANPKITTVLSPAWTTEWISEQGRKKLEDYGIAPPRLMKKPEALVRCPQCKSEACEEIAYFGSTPCKALWKCLSCKEPFDYFKCH